MTGGQVWIGVGFLGETFFGLRMLVQWLASERARRSTIPLAFWYLSIAGNATLLAYAIYRRDPVFIAGEVLGLCVSVRNLVLIGTAPGTTTAASRNAAA
jgi:lipid-A-disaccharide synthase-like uncharacterized protein